MQAWSWSDRLPAQPQHEQEASRCEGANREFPPSQRGNNHPSVEVVGVGPSTSPFPICCRDGIRAGREIYICGISSTYSLNFEFHSPGNPNQKLLSVPPKPHMANQTPSDHEQRKADLMKVYNQLNALYADKFDKLEAEFNRKLQAWLNEAGKNLYSTGIRPMSPFHLAIFSKEFQIGSGCCRRLPKQHLNIPRRKGGLALGSKSR